MRQSGLVKYSLIFIAILAMLSGCTSQAEDDREYEPVEPTTKDFCPIDGVPPAKMATNFYPANFPQWNSQIIFNSGAAVHFESPKHLFHYLLGLDKYGNETVWLKDKSIIRAIYVTDYRTGEYVPAKAAYYVVNSGVEGPVGEDLVAFGKEARASEFIQEHRGRTVSFDGVDKELLRNLEYKGWRGRY